MSNEEKVQEILKRLYQIWPHPHTELHYTTPWELLVATILSAQTTDKLVNTITPTLFATYPTISAYAKASPREIEAIIRKVNFAHPKAGYIHTSAHIIEEKFNGKVPETLAELISLPGVARKTANVVLGDAFHKQEGIVVDTHVKRLSQCLGLTDNTNPVKIEQDLMAIVPHKNWIDFSHLLILYGRYYCPARKDCHTCPILTDLFV